MRKTIYFDMDGTIANLYGIDNWLEKLRSEDASPYTEAEVLLNMSLLARYLNKLQKMGYRLGIISWLAKDSTASYDKAVEAAKREWLQFHLRSVKFNEINITAYGVPKLLYMSTDDDILFDDNESIREEWIGKAYEPSEILSVLKELIDRG